MSLYPLLISLISLGVALPQASALSMKPYALSELWSESQVVARGSVIATRVYRERGRIWTEFTLAPSEAPMRDRRDSTTSRRDVVNFALLGGTLDGITQVIPGTPRLTVGQELIVFLRCRAAQSCSPVGLGQGIWTPQREEARGEERGEERDEEGNLWAPMTRDVVWVGSAHPNHAVSLAHLMSSDTSISSASAVDTPRSRIELESRDLTQADPQASPRPNSLSQRPPTLKRVPKKAKLRIIP